MIYDTVIIGGGVVGLSILRTALLSGYNAILFERNPHLCDEASGRNSGIICTGVDAPAGTYYSLRCKPTATIPQYLITTSCALADPTSILRFGKSFAEGLDIEY